MVWQSFVYMYMCSNLHISKPWYHCDIRMIRSELCLGGHRLLHNYAKVSHRLLNNPMEVPLQNKNRFALSKLKFQTCISVVLGFKATDTSTTVIGFEYILGDKKQSMLIVKITKAAKNHLRLTEKDLQINLHRPQRSSFERCRINAKSRYTQDTKESRWRLKII